MKKRICFLMLIVIIVAIFCSCSYNSSLRKSLQGCWVYRQSDDCYIYLEFNGDEAKYAVNSLGEDVQSTIIRGKYTMEDNQLVIDDCVHFSIKYDGENYRIFDKYGTNEFIKQP